MVKNFLILAGVVLASYLLFSYTGFKALDTASIYIRDVELRVRVVRTPAEQASGLSGVTQLGVNEGMLFPFEPPQVVSFWNKGMLIPFDIIWIANGEIVGIVENIPNASQEPLTYVAPQAIDFVVETNAEWAKIHQIRVGDEVKIYPRQHIER